MFFSIIVPIYNVEMYLRKCIDSIVKQNFKDYEVLLIDDCSTDGSLNIAESYLKYEFIHIIKKEKNTGLSDTRNIGMRVALGEYILFIDSDDYIEQGCLKKLQEIVIEREYPDIVYTGFIEERDFKQYKIYGYASKKNKFYDGITFLKSELRKRTLFAPVWFGIYKKEFLISNNLYFKEGIFHEDELWTPQVVYYAKKIYTSDLIFYHYLRHGNSITKAKDKTKNGIDLINSCKELEKLFSAEKDPELLILMRNHIAMLYMKAMCRGKLYRKEYANIIDKKYPIKHTFFIYDRLKSLLFLISLRLYYVIDLKLGDNER